MKERHYFVLGDNRDASNYSRVWGFVPEENIYARVAELAKRGIKISEQ